jgi:branched-chain amino acid transport system permease protein
MMKRHWPRLALLAALAASFEVSRYADRIDLYVLRVLIMMGINIVLAVSLNLVNGHTGQFSLGHAGFMAVGAYVSAFGTLGLQFPLWNSPPGHGVLSLLFRLIVAIVNPLIIAGNGLTAEIHALPPWLQYPIAMVAGGLIAAAVGLAVGLPSLRLKGDYLAIVTLGFGEIIRVVLQNTDSLGGARGLSGIPQYTSFFWAFTMAAITIYVIGSLVNSSYGRGFLAVRDDEVAAEAMGINTTKYKVTAFALGAFFAGIAGGLYAHSLQFIAPNGFDFQKSVDVVIMVIIGGMGSTLGVAVAAAGITALNEYLGKFEQYRMIIFSLLLIVMMILRPQGLLGSLAGLRWTRKAAR